MLRLGGPPVPDAFLHHFVVFVFCRKVLRFALGRPALRPTGDQFELLGSQGLIVAEIPETFYSPPRRHPSLQNLFFDGGSPWECFLVLHQGERRSTFPMTGNAPRIKDAGDFSIPGDGCCDDVVSESGRYKK